ncbi:oxidoreductase [Talaromyces proteolyticus]|uniref:Oxidoreductase n=1 Tax=Talaromyces proteolyticus TaxID=1131652 RepID=A0AAD4KDX3_9EURO|nr:oxidoreductase [Talaromyces proteolyticus]KAH8689343.1 oxidoreductase [Talaromyces proteolyticus]
MATVAGKVFTITGGASGMGAATARLLAERGARAIAVADVSSKGFPDLKHSIAKINPSTELQFTELNVTNPAAVNQWVEDVVAKFGDIHGSANIAGIPQALGVRQAPAILEESNEAWNRVMDVNLNGVFYCTKAEVKAMKDLAPGKRSVVNVASIAARQHIGDVYAYNVSKVACSHFSASVAKDTKPFGIRVNAVLPGATTTPMLKKFITHTKTEEEFEKAWKDWGLDLISAEDVARSIVWLLSEDSHPVYGAEINVGTGLP